MELMDIAIRLHRHMQLLGTLGPNETRFQMRMYLHLQYATVHRVLHVSGNAMGVFKEATEVFLARLDPGTKAKSTISRTPRTPTAASPGATPKRPRARGNTRRQSAPTFGCYLCPARDHYCNDRKFHPLLPSGKYAGLSKDKKAAVLARIDAPNASADEKASEKKTVRDFWKRRCEPCKP